MISLEEAKSLAVWEKLQATLLKNESHLKVSDEKFNQSKETYQSYGVWVKLLVFLLTSTVVFLDIELLVSLVYYNNMPQKLIAVLIAVVGWLLTYKSWFRSKPQFLSSLWSPGVPGNNHFIALIER